VKPPQRVQLPPGPLSNLPARGRVVHDLMFAAAVSLLAGAVSLVCSTGRRERIPAAGLVAVPCAVPGRSSVGTRQGHRLLAPLRLPRGDDAPRPRPPGGPVRHPWLHERLVQSEVRSPSGLASADSAWLQETAEIHRFWRLLLGMPSAKPLPEDCGCCDCCRYCEYRKGR
jgi:hypothetical protein